MNAGKFIKLREMVEHRHYKGRSTRWRKRALAAIEREAGAVPRHSGGRLLGHVLEGGETVCVKQRYKTEHRAASALNQIAREPANGRTKPIRSYLCAHCGGWHLTSER